MKTLAILLILLLLPGCDSGGGSPSGGGTPHLPQNPPDLNPNALLVAPRSATAFENYMLEGLRQWGGVSNLPISQKTVFIGSPIVAALDVATDDAGATATASSSGSVASSETNVIVAGVDEADRARYDGEYVYLVNESHLQIIRTEMDGPGEIASTMDLEQSGSAGLYLYQSGAERNLVNIRANGGWGWFEGWYAPWYWSGTTGLDFVDASSATAPEIKESVQIDGTYVNSRRIGNTLYLITRYSPGVDGLVHFASSSADKTHNRQLINNLDRTHILPQVHFSDGTSVPLVSASDCLIPTNGDGEIVYYPTVTAVAAFDMERPGEFSSICMADGVDGIHVSQKAIYLSAMAPITLSDTVSVTNSSASEGETIIHKVAIDGTRPRYVGSGKVQGSFWGDPAFLMGENGGYLTAITSMWGNNGSVAHRLSILGPTGKAYELEVLGHIPNPTRSAKIGKPNEQIYAARIMGDRAYVVTYKKIDPVYVIDVGNPTDPRILGEVEIPGFSSYLHPVSEDLVVGVGKNTDDQGSFAWFQSVSVRLFDVSDPTRIEVVADIPIGRRPSDTPVRWDHHAFTILGENGVDHIAIPVNVYGAHVREVPDSPSHYYPWTEDALYLFELNEAQRTLTAAGRVVAQDETTGQRTQPHCCSWNDRSFMTGDTIHYLSGARLFTANWRSPLESSNLFIPTMFASDGKGACTEAARESLRIYARDRDTDASISCEKYTIGGIDGTFNESCSDMPANRLFETPGSFSLTVTADGYVPWHTEDVRVQRDDCHVGTVHINVPMTHE